MSRSPRVGTPARHTRKVSRYYIPPLNFSQADKVVYKILVVPLHRALYPLDRRSLRVTWLALTVGCPLLLRNSQSSD